MKGFTASPEGFFEDFRLHSLRTVRLVRVFDDSDLQMRPAAGSMTLSEQCNHICASHNFTRSVLEDPVPTVDAFNCTFETSTVEGVVSSVKMMLDKVRLAAARITQDRWKERVAPFGPDWRMSRGQLAYMMIDHESHHRGQITVYARVAGKVPPTLYAPVSESLLEPRAQDKKVSVKQEGNK